MLFTVLLSLTHPLIFLHKLEGGEDSDRLLDIQAT
jgi:hypothetical protein